MALRTIRIVYPDGPTMPLYHGYHAFCILRDYWRKGVPQTETPQDWEDVWSHLFSSKDHQVTPGEDITVEDLKRIQDAMAANVNYARGSKQLSLFSLLRIVEEVKDFSGKLTFSNGSAETWLDNRMQGIVAGGRYTSGFKNREEAFEHSRLAFTRNGWIRLNSGEKRPEDAAVNEDYKKHISITWG